MRIIKLMQIYANSSISAHNKPNYKTPKGIQGVMLFEQSLSTHGRMSINMLTE